MPSLRFLLWPYLVDDGLLLALVAAVELDNVGKSCRLLISKHAGWVEMYMGVLLPRVHVAMVRRRRWRWWRELVLWMLVLVLLLLLMLPALLVHLELPHLELSELLLSEGLFVLLLANLLLSVLLLLGVLPLLGRQAWRLWRCFNLFTLLFYYALDAAFWIYGLHKLVVLLVVLRPDEIQSLVDGFPMMPGATHPELYTTHEGRQERHCVLGDAGLMARREQNGVPVLGRKFDNSEAVDEDSVGDRRILSQDK